MMTQVDYLEYLKGGKMNKVVPKTAFKLQHKLIASVPKDNTYAGKRRPVVKK